MNEEKINQVVVAIKKINVGMIAMEASGNYKHRSKIALSDIELKEYIDSVKSEIYSAIASNLILQEIFAEELSKPEVLKSYIDESDKVLTILKATGI